MDWRVTKSHGLMAEYEARYPIRGRPGARSVLLFLNTARMGSYEQVLADPAAYGNDVAATRADGRHKYGFALSIEQQLTERPRRLPAPVLERRPQRVVGLHRDRSFARASASSRTARSGIAPSTWSALAVVASGLSPWHERYLAGGGYGFIIGDGALHYGPEVLGDIYYKLQLSELLSLSAIYQPIINPAYNRDRGPVHVFAGRFHVAF